MDLDTVGNTKSLLGEGPVWNVERQTIFWLDILNGLIHEYVPASKEQKSIAVNEMIGSFAFCENGKIIAATKSGFGFLEIELNQLEIITNPEKHLPNNRFNDGKCDPFGRFWAGTMSLSEEANTGSLYVFSENEVSKKIENITISNGIAWSNDHKTMYFIDTPTLEVVAYDYEISTGNIANKKVVIRIPKSEGFPDGMTIDKEGMLWIAHWNGWQVTRWNPNTGEKLSKIQLPVANVTSCTFGGQNLTDLYITTAKEGLTTESFKKQPLAGSLFILRDCGFQGFLPFKFK